MSSRLVSLLLAVGLVPLAQPLAAAPEVGGLHPDFTLPEITTGTPVSLSSFRGRKVLLIQFASW